MARVQHFGHHPMIYPAVKVLAEVLAMAVAPLLTYDLELIQAQTFRRRFSWNQAPTGDPASYADFNDWDFYGQVRAKEDRSSDLLLDLTAYLSVVDQTAGDGKYLWLVIPGSGTAGLEAGPFNKTAAWDIFLVAKSDITVDQLLIQGGVSMDPSATDMVGGES